MNQDAVEALHPFYAEFPKRFGPPPVPPYKGTDYLNARTPEITVTLDAGAFRAVWELLEVEAKHRYPTKSTMKWVQAMCRAVESLRESYWKENTPPPEEPKALTTGKPTQKKTQAAPETPKQPVESVKPKPKFRRIRPSGSGPAA